MRPYPAGQEKGKTQSFSKGHLQARKAALPPCSVPIFPLAKTAHSVPHSATQGIKQPRPTPSGASRGIIICCGPEIARRNGTCRRPTRRIYFCCTSPRLCSLMFLKPLQELIVARGASRDRIDSRLIVAGLSTIVAGIVDSRFHSRYSSTTTDPAIRSSSCFWSVIVPSGLLGVRTTSDLSTRPS